METLADITEAIVAFRDERDWEQFHTPRHLATAISIETAELQEVFLWKTGEEVEEALQEESVHAAVLQEIADVLIFSLLLCHELGIDPAVAVREKLRHNADKYPVEKARGESTKYTDLR